MFKKGQRIKVTGDSILSDVMGLGQVVTGTVFTVNEQGKVIGFKCDQTRAIEGIDDGKIEVIE